MKKKEKKKRPIQQILDRRITQRIHNGFQTLRRVDEQQSRIWDGCSRDLIGHFPSGRWRREIGDGLVFHFAVADGVNKIRNTTDILVMYGR